MLAVVVRFTIMYSVVVQGNTKMRDIPTPETIVLMLWEKSGLENGESSSTEHNSYVFVMVLLRD